MSIVGPLRRIHRTEIRNFTKGIAFISPWLIGFLAWTVYPILASFYYSFTQYDVLNPPKWVGLRNYLELLLEDEKFRIVLGNTLYFVLLGVPIGVVVAFGLASLLNNEMRGRSFFRTIFFLPAIVPAVATAMVWLWIYNPRYGLINSILASLGQTAIPWLSSPAMAKPSLIIIHAWAQGSAIVIFLAALQDVPRSLYDAALVDGANAWQRFWNVTIPMCTPAILFVLITSLIGMFQYFTLGWLLTGGGPNLATEFYGIYLYRNAFQFFKMGYASALAWLLFLLVVVFTIIVFRSSARWVYYGGSME
ncbi:MAG: sugar ABC transporter permease [Chloroflexi bacterium]|nr:sugar ABC transporter permease [Chloroflexota bacterium]